MPMPAPDYDLGQFFDLSPDLLCIAGFDGYFKRLNPSFERVLGYSGEELMSRPFLEFVHPDDVERARDAFIDRATGEDVIGFECRLVCVDGSARRFEWNTRTLPHLGVRYGVARDVTVRSALAEEQAALRRVATLVARGVPPDDVFEAIAREAGRLLGVDLMHMGRYDTEGAISVAAGWSRAGDHLPVGTRVELDGTNVAALVLQSGRPERIDGYSEAGGTTAERLRHRMHVSSSVAVPIVVDGRLWGLMTASSMEDRPLPADTESRLLGFTELAETAISNTEARTEVAASRARIVVATDEERRKVVRDLHDGAQQRLVHTIITLKLARRALQNEQEDATALLTEALDNAEQATAELRELAHGILPTALTKGGLRAGVDALASRMPVPVENGVSVGRLPAAVEATAYFVVAEALTNVAKHARADRAAVTARVEDGTLIVHVRDDGVGGAQRTGSGLTGLKDRLAALDGELRVESPGDRGTVVAATLPLPG